jgi:precorrin-3B synthase
MTSRAKHLRRGWCPGALRPMESGDGLIVRLRRHSGGFGVDTLIALAGAARRYGNGQIDLTRRANLQIRGVTRETLPPLLLCLADRGLLDARTEAEAVRNILVSPLTGADPSEVLDVRPLAVDVARLLETEVRLWSLPAKFSFAIDGGGALPLDSERTDIRLRAIALEAEPRIAVGIDRPGGTLWLGRTTPEAAPAAVAGMAHAVLETLSAGGRIRSPDLAGSAVENIRAAVARIVDRLETPPAPRERAAPVGLLKHGAFVFAAGVAVPFGRLESETLRNLADVLAAAGAEELRLSPWRILYVPLSQARSAERILRAAAGLGLIVDGEDPLLKVTACPGAPTCRSATMDTRGDARLIASAIAAYPGIHSVHVSGCPKGCARSEPADLVLVAGDSGYGLVRNGTARDPPQRTIGRAELTGLPAIFSPRKGAPSHV